MDSLLEKIILSFLTLVVVLLCVLVGLFVANALQVRSNAHPQTIHVSRLDEHTQVTNTGKTVTIHTYRYAYDGDSRYHVNTSNLFAMLTEGQTYCLLVGQGDIFADKFITGLVSYGKCER